jgi:hypothetical protein
VIRNVLFAPVSRGAVRASTSLILTLTSSVSVALAAGMLKRVSAARGATSATLTYRMNRGSAVTPVSDLRLTIRHAGRALVSGPVHAVLCGTLCWPGPGNVVLEVTKLARNGSPDVVLNLYSGGAHCCSITQVYRYDRSSGTYVRAQRDFGDPGARLETLAGRPVFLSADDRFAYEFAAFAFSGMPVQLWSFSGGRFVDVTARYPKLIERDAARQLGAWRANRSQGVGLGFIAAWAADEDLLGHESLVRSTLAHALARGELRSIAGWKGGAAFVAQLQRFLAGAGYLGVR